MPFPSGILIQNNFKWKKNQYSIILRRYDLTALYPLMYLYILTLSSNGKLLGEFRTNTYEYSPTITYSAEKTALKFYSEWLNEMDKDPEGFVEFLEKKEYNKKKQMEIPKQERKDAVIIQGSPRPDGNCAIIAGWIKESLSSAGYSSKVIFPDDMIIHPCIGCYQCYNYGHCTFSDEMNEILESVKNASLLAVCTPVYTNTVPAGLKICIDRFQSYHAMKNIANIKNPEITELLKNKKSAKTRKREIKGLLFAVSGRGGLSNFDHLLPVTEAFFANAGIKFSGKILTDNTDSIRSVRTYTGLEDKIKNLTINTAKNSQYHNKRI